MIRISRVIITIPHSDTAGTNGSGQFWVEQFSPLVQFKCVPEHCVIIEFVQVPNRVLQQAPCVSSGGLQSISMNNDSVDAKHDFLPSRLTNECSIKTI